MEQAQNYLEERFGVAPDDPVMNGLALKLVADDIWLTLDDTETSLDVKTYGIRCVRIQDIGLKPTTYALQFFNEHITKNVVELSRNELLAVLDGDLVDTDTDVTEGYVALKHDGRVWGCGMYRNRTASSRIPKGRAKELRACF